jgi:hypothetical protein
MVVRESGQHFPRTRMLKRRESVVALIGAGGLVVAYLLLKYLHPFGLQPWMVREVVERFVVLPVRDLLMKTILTPLFGVALVTMAGLEYFVRQTWVAIPFLVLRVDPSRIVWFSIFAWWHTALNHGNIRTNLGPLRYLIVTPQSHHIHHSLEPRHRDRNFGSILCLWDHLAGTQYHGYDEYPETGIADGAFPHERAVGLRSLLLGPLIQMVYPFRQGTEES